MRNNSTGTLAEYLGAAIMITALFLLVQFPGGARATDTFDQWDLSVSVQGNGSFIDPGDGWLPFQAAFNFNVNTSVFQLYDVGIDPFPEHSTDLWMQSLDSIQGTCSAEFWSSDPNNVTCRPAKFEGSVEKNFIENFIMISVYKSDYINRFSFQIQVSPSANSCGWWTPGNCYSPNPYCFPMLELGWYKGLRTNDCGIMVFDIDYKDLKSLWRIAQNFQGTMDSNCLNEAGYWGPYHPGSVLSWNATVAIRVHSYTPFGKPTIRKPPSPGVLKLLLIDP